jgi:DNA-directed RNA polymerase specialized sigma24 family protein
MPLNSLSDSDLWDLITADNYRAFTALYERHWFTLFKTAQKYIKNDETCEEVVHDLFLTLWKRRAHLNIIDFNHYLKAAARYQVYAYLKKTKASHLIYRDEIFDSAGVYEMNQAMKKYFIMSLKFNWPNN